MFSLCNTKASTLMKLHTHVHYTHFAHSHNEFLYKLPPWGTMPIAINDFWPWPSVHAWLNNVESVYLAPFLKHLGLYFYETSYIHPPWQTLPAAINCYLHRPTLHSCLNNVYSVGLAPFQLHWGLYTNETSYVYLDIPCPLPLLLLTLTYFSYLTEQCLVCAIPRPLR